MYNINTQSTAKRPIHSRRNGRPNCLRRAAVRLPDTERFLPDPMIPCDREAPLVLEIEPDIEDAGAMSEPADRDQIDAGRGDRRRRLWRDPPRGFGHRAAIDHGDRLGELIQAHVVE